MTEFEKISRPHQKSEDSPVTRPASRDKKRSTELKPLFLTGGSFPANYPWIAPRIDKRKKSGSSDLQPVALPEKADESPGDRTYLSAEAEERERLRDEFEQILPGLLERLENRLPSSRFKLETYRRLAEIGKQFQKLKSAIAKLQFQSEERERLRNEFGRRFPEVLEHLESKSPSGCLTMEAYRRLVAITSSLERYLERAIAYAQSPAKRNATGRFPAPARSAARENGWPPQHASISIFATRGTHASSPTGCVAETAASPRSV